MNDEIDASEVAQRLAEVRERIERACEKAGRSAQSVRLLAVAKGHPHTAIRAAYAAGQREFGENYMQELAAKSSQLEDLADIRWRFIGHLQQNKAKEAARIGCAVDALDSVRVAQTLGHRAQVLGRRLDVMIQVNVAGEPQKAGCALEELPGLVETVRSTPALNLQGLMVIPPAVDDAELNRPWFRTLRQLATRYALGELSMGMSDDVEVAVEEGTTMVRVGTAIFGERRYA
ncbi:MAG: YggS family pyridoxal phosphate-dependent enzyme [Deltaproteobacteria bacterium]|nr:YggS family pyridoxal phosphate-dependent enzyme [Deltaproteobacteria bacterium]